MIVLDLLLNYRFEKMKKPNCHYIDLVVFYPLTKNLNYYEGAAFYMPKKLIIGEFLIYKILDSNLTIILN